MDRERESKLVLGKIHISQWIKEEWEDRIESLIFSGDEHISEKGRGKGKFTWVFGDGLVEIIDNEKVIFGRLGKIKKELTETVYNPSLTLSSR